MRLAAAAPLFTGMPGTVQPDSVGVPFALEHGRIVVDAVLESAQGARVPVRAWLDTGNPELWVTQELAGHWPADVTASGPPTLALAGLRLSLEGGGVPRTIPAPTVGPGLGADLNLPSSVLRSWDVVIDFPRRRITLALPGRLRFAGRELEARVAPGNGLVDVPTRVGGRFLRMGVDLGTPVSFLARVHAVELAAAHPGWPRQRGATGRANLWGSPEEARWELTRVEGVTLAGVPARPITAVTLPGEGVAWLSQRAGTALDGLLGTDAFLDATLGVDYARQRVFLVRSSHGARRSRGAVPLVLGVDREGRYSVIGLASSPDLTGRGPVRVGDELLEVDGVPVTGAGMGAVWDLLAGDAGESRELRLRREGEEIVVRVPVEPILAAPGDLAGHAGP